MTLVNVAVGATTPTSARVVAKVTTGDVAVLVADNADMVDPATYGPVATTLDVAPVTITGLNPGTKYWYQVSDDGVVDTSVTGSFRTHPPLGEPAEFTVALASCAGTSPTVPGVGPALNTNKLSNHPVFASIAGTEPLMFCHMGDLHYYDPGSGEFVPDASLSTYRSAYDDVLHQPNQALLYRSVAWQYVWDDHDYGPNNSDATNPDKANAQQVYRERVPHYSLPGTTGLTGPIYQTWQIGRVLFIASDSRSERTPNDAPDGPSKSMLGLDQKNWMRGVLETSSAEFFCWITPSVWHHQPGAIDTWMQFPDEQAEMIGMFTDLGWIDRMCAVWGDRHVLGIDSGANTPGNIPGFQYAGLDSSPSGVVSGLFDTGDASAERGQWGILRFNDVGGEIRVTGTGFVDDVSIRTFTFTVDTPTPPPPDPGGLPPIAVAEIRQQVTWLSCDLTSGRIIAELPDITGNVSRVLTAYTSESLTVPIPIGGPAAVPLETVLAATQPARTMIVAVVNNIPTWAGIVLTRNGGTGATLTLGCATPEQYLTRRVVRDHIWTGQDQVSFIAAGLASDAGNLAGVGSGIGFIIDAPASAVLRDRTYLLSDRKTVYEALRELAGVNGGPEWTVDLDWTDATQTAVAKILRIRGHIGAVSEAVFQSSASSMFSSQGSSDARYTHAEDYTESRHANYVVAYSSGEGQDQPASTPAVDQPALDSGVPIWERHYQPSTSIIEIATLNSHATAELARVRGGSLTWTIEARWSEYPRYGIDWRLGDDIRFELTGHRHPPPSSGAAGVTGMARCIGFAMNIQTGTISPILLDPQKGLV